MANARLAVFDSLNADDVFIAVPLVGLKLGAPTMIRTQDISITNAALYQLSYKGIYGYYTAELVLMSTIRLSIFLFDQKTFLVE
jgi:hypothetical protein